MRIPLIGVNVSTGAIALGAVGVIVAPKVLPVLTDLLRGAIKTGMKGGMIAIDKSQKLVSDTTDTFQNLASEAKSEISKDSRPALKKKAAA